MTYEELKELTQSQANTPPRKAGTGYEEPPEMPTEEERREFNQFLRANRMPRRSVNKVVKQRRVAA